MGINDRKVAGRALAALGVLVVLAEVILHFVSWYFSREYELNHGIVLVGAVIGFVGFYMLDPMSAQGGAGVIVDSATRIIQSLPRFGRRSTDAVAVPGSTTAVVALPTEPPAPPTGESGGIKP